MLAMLYAKANIQKRFVKRNEDDVLYIGSKIVNKPGLRISTRKSDIETFSEPSTSRSSCSSKNQVLKPFILELLT